MTAKELLLSNLSKGIMSCDKVKIISLLNCNPMTVQNIVSSGWAVQTVSARLSELMAIGLVKKQKIKNNKSLFFLVKDTKESELLQQEIETKKALRFFQNACEKGYLVFNEINSSWEFNIAKLKFKN